MTIECPYCREECLSDVDSIPPEGLEIECRSCQMRFIMRPHESDSVSPPRGQEHLSVREPSPDLYSAVLRTRKPIPAWMAFAYHTPPPPLAPPAEPEGSLLTRDIQEDGAQTDAEQPILVDDTLFEDNPYADEPFTPQAHTPSRGKPWKGKGRSAGAGGGKRWIVWVLVLALAGALLLLTWKLGFHGIFQKADDLSRSIAGMISSGEEDEGGLHFSDLNSDFVQRKGGKPKVFYIEGTVTNNYPKPCHSIRVTGILFDERGKRSAEETVFCGNILSKKELRSASDETIRKSLQNPVGSSLSNFNIQTGTSIPFMLVFFDPPDKLSEFSIEIAGYKLHESVSE